MAIFADPLGAVLGLWQPKRTPGRSWRTSRARYCWSELITTDLDASKIFYKAVFGWDAEDQGVPGRGPRLHRMEARRDALSAG